MSWRLKRKVAGNLVPGDDTDGEAPPKQASKNDSDGEAPPKKASRNVSGDDDSTVVCEISKNRRVSVRNWQGKVMVDIREFYVKDGKELPGKKGIVVSAPFGDLVFVFKDWYNVAVVLAL